MEWLDPDAYVLSLLLFLFAWRVYALSRLARRSRAK